LLDKKLILFAEKISKGKKMNNLLTNRKYDITEDPYNRDNRVTWYTPLHFLEQYKSVEKADHFNTTSSAGDWEGYIVQKIKNKRYLIYFSQVNNGFYSSGYTVYTGDVIDSWEGEISEDDILTIINDYIDFLNLQYMD
jgi:hypothetical protein